MTTPAKKLYPKPRTEPGEVFEVVRDYVYLHPLRPIPEAPELADRLAGTYLPHRPDTADVVGALDALDVERGAAA